jgi:hypothetical protein
MNERMKEFLTIKNIVISALIAAIYATVTIILAPISYGPIQVRVSEALTLLPYLWPQAIPGLFIGCLIANFAGGFGIIDVVFGSAATLIAAIITSRMPTPYLAAVPPIFHCRDIAAMNEGMQLHAAGKNAFYLLRVRIADIFLNKFDWGGRLVDHFYRKNPARP